MWTPEAVKELLRTNNDAVLRALIALYEQQTYDEQNSHNTKEVNGIGFNKFDATFLTSLAKDAKQYNALTPRQMEAARKALMKYAKQLSRIAIMNEIPNPQKRPLIPGPAGWP